MELFPEAVRRNPWPLYDQLRARGPVLREPQTGLWMVLDYEGVKRTLHDHAAFSSEASPGGLTAKWFMFSDPPRHTVLRGLVMRAFTPRVVAALEPRIRELSKSLLDEVAPRGEMDVVRDYAAPLPMMVIAALLGADPAEWPLFTRWGDGVLGLASTITGSPDVEQRIATYRAVTAEMDAYLAAMSDARRARPREDLLTKLLEAELDGERLSREELLAFFQLLLLAGSETTTNLIANAMLTFLEHPGEQERLAADPASVPAAVEEVLRLRSPVQAMFRIARQDVEMRGQVIPARSLVLAMIGAANRDPKQFAEPARFDPRREPNAHLAFGHGIHFCIGAPLARLEGRIALPDLAQRLRAPRLTGEWTPRYAFHVHGATSLPIAFTSADKP